MCDNQNISENKSLADLLKTSNDFKALGKVVSFFEKLGIKNNRISEAFSKVLDLVSQTTEMVEMPDRFNNHFSRNGWVAYESLNFTIMKEAVYLADAGKHKEANDLLIDHYNQDTLKYGLIGMQAVDAYRDRKVLAQKAKEDYLADRYHACIPVVLMIIDGIVNDIENKGFFASGVNLTAWDSIAAHSSGLQQLAKMFNSSRKSTVKDRISVPYRHGILHGRDLGYANKEVAAKTWATLFTIKDWALAVKYGKKIPIETKRESSFLESLRSYSETLKRKKELEAWRPRILKVDTDFPKCGKPEEYKPQSPEREVGLFYSYWKSNNFGKMASIIKSFGSTPISKRAGDLRTLLEGKALIQFKILNIIDEAPAISEIETEVTISHNEKDTTLPLKLRLLCEDDKGNPVPISNPNGAWRILDFSLNPIYGLI